MPLAGFSVRAQAPKHPPDSAVELRRLRCVERTVLKDLLAPGFPSRPKHPIRLWLAHLWAPFDKLAWVGLPDYRKNGWKAEQ